MNRIENSLSDKSPSTLSSKEKSWTNVSLKIKTPEETRSRQTAAEWKVYD